MNTDAVTLHQLWRETTRKLEAHAREVRENKGVLEASLFARWLTFSGVVKMLEANPQPEPLRVDGAALRRLAHEVISLCGEAFKSGRADPKYAASDIAEINRKLDLLLSPSSAAATARVGDAAEPALRVLEGGVQCS